MTFQKTGENMIKITIWNEFVQEQFTEENLERLGMQDMSPEYRNI